MSKKGRIGFVVAAPLVLAAALFAGLMAAQGHAASPSATASATLKAKAGSKGRGVFTGALSTTTSSSGRLSWKLIYTNLSGRVTGIQLRQGSKIVNRLCVVGCSSGVHRTATLRGKTLTAVKAGKTTLTVATRKY